MPKLAISRFDKYRLVTDRRTDGQRDGQTHDDSKYRASIASRGKKNQLRGCGLRANVRRLLQSLLIPRAPYFMKSVVARGDLFDKNNYRRLTVVSRTYACFS